MKKKYYEFMNELSSDELYEGLLGYGLFNDKLPPVLTSKVFSDYCQMANPVFGNTKATNHSDLSIKKFDHFYDISSIKAPDN